MSIPAENIRDWQGRDVVDAKGDKIGSMESVYFDTGTDHPAFASVEIGIIGRHRLVFVPLDGAAVAPTYLKVQVDKKTARDSPSIATDGELSRDDETAVYAHYGIAYEPGAGGERRLGRR
jgi:hypothetical protein